MARTKFPAKKRFAVGARVIVIMPGVAGVVTQVDDEPASLGEYWHEIKTNSGERHEPGSNLELVPEAVTNVKSDEMSGNMEGVLSRQAATRPNAKIMVTIGCEC